MESDIKGVQHSGKFFRMNEGESVKLQLHDSSSSRHWGSTGGGLGNCNWQPALNSDSHLV